MLPAGSEHGSEHGSERPSLRRRTTRLAAAVLALAAVMMSVPACGRSPGDVAAAPGERAVTVETAGCGHASATAGSGVAVADGEVLTVAHVVAGASSVEVTDRDGQRQRAAIVAYDPARDLALLEVPELLAGPVELAELEPSEAGEIVGGRTPATVPFVVLRPVEVEIDEVRGAGRTVRAGYELEASVATGDSGAGAYDRLGRLGGVVFASNRDDDRITWATAASEIGDFLADPGTRGSFACDPSRSRLVPAAEVRVR